MPTYVIKPGDTLTSIAHRHGINSWQTLYNDPSNAAFRAKRPNPNFVVVGDEINIPASANPAAAQHLRPCRVAIIDGTGDDDDAQYARDMKHSFCRQLYESMTGHAYYQRGPCSAGMDVAGEAWAAYKDLRDFHQVRPEARLMLAGYSRGGSAAILAAELLESKGNRSRFVVSV